MAAEGGNWAFELHPCAAAHVNSSRDKRVAEVQREHFIENARSEPIWTRVRNLFLKPNGTASNATLLLYAESGVGKTELLQFIVDKIDEEIREAAAAGVKTWLSKPLHFLVDRCSTESLLVQRLSAGLQKGRRSPREDVEAMMTLIETWKRSNSIALLMDELSDIGKGTPASQEVVCQVLRMIMNRYNRPIVATANLAGAEIFAMDKNLTTRIQTIEIKPWKADAELQGFLWQAFEFKCLKHAPAFSGDDWEEFLPWIVGRTGGITREIMARTNLAAVYAIDSGLERMCKEAYLESEKLWGPQ